MGLLGLLGCLGGKDPVERALHTAQKAARDDLGIADPKLDTWQDPEIPGLLVFQAEHYDGSVSLSRGAVVDGVLYTQPAEALGQVFAAWGYGPEPTRTPEQVAAAAVMLVPAQEASKVLSSPDDLAYAAKEGFPDAQAPTQTTLKGQPAVLFWYGNGYNPLTEVSVAPSAEGGPAQIQVGRSHGGG